MSKSEHLIQDEIRLALSEYGIVLRLNSGKFWQGKRVWSNEFKQYVLTNLRAVQGCPQGTSDLIFIGEDIAFIECKDDIGKPRPEMLTLAMEKYGYSKEESVMIGDRVYTDIASGYNAGIDTIFVLSGEGTMEDAEKSETPPTYIFPGIREVYEKIKK